jgi:HPt (histidine-containing phosphotransfer) domain-containing protein
MSTYAGLASSTGGDTAVEFAADEVSSSYATRLIDRGLLEEIRRIERAGGGDMLAGFVCRLEGNLADFAEVFSDHVAHGDARGALRAAHSLKGMCHQLGARALGELFADIERSVKAGDYADARRKFDGGNDLIARSLDALKRG